MLLAGVTGAATVPSFLVYWTHSLVVARVMLWLFIPAIYFYIGPAMALVQNLAAPRMRAVFIAVSLLLANVLNLSGNAGGGLDERRLCRRARGGRGLLAPGSPDPRAGRLLGGVALLGGGKDRHR